MKPTHNSLLLRVSCLRTHQTVFNSVGSLIIIIIIIISLFINFSCFLGGGGYENDNKTRMVLRFQYQITQDRYFGLRRVLQCFPLVLRAQMTEAILLVDCKCMNTVTAINNTKSHTYCGWRHSVVH